MSESGWHPYHERLIGGQTRPDPLTERLGVTPEIDSNIENFPGDDAHELTLGILDLVMQAAQYAALRTRLVILDEIDVDAELCQHALVVTFQKKPARVAVDFRLQQ